MRRIGARHRPEQAEFRTMGVEPLPDGIPVSVGAGDIDRAAVAVASGRLGSAMLRVTAMRLEAGCEALTIVVAERAEHRPSDSGRVQGPAGMEQLLAEVGVH